MRDEIETDMASRTVQRKRDIPIAIKLDPELRDFKGPRLFSSHLLIQTLTLPGLPPLASENSPLLYTRRMHSQEQRTLARTMLLGDMSGEVITSVPTIAACVQCERLRNLSQT